MDNDKFARWSRAIYGQFDSRFWNAPDAEQWEYSARQRFILRTEDQQRMADVADYRFASQYGVAYGRTPSGEPGLTVENIREAERQLKTAAQTFPNLSTPPIEPTLCDIEIPQWAPRWVPPAPPQFQSCDHLKKVLQRSLTHTVLQQCQDALAGVDFDSLAFSGMSGALVAPILAHLMEKEIIMVRIPGTPGCHSVYPVEGFRGSKRYVIVDDLVCTGKTCTRIIRGIRLFAPKAELIGLMLYNSFFHSPEYNSFFHSPEEETFKFVMDEVNKLDKDGK